MAKMAFGMYIAFGMTSVRMSTAAQAGVAVLDYDLS